MKNVKRIFILASVGFLALAANFTFAAKVLVLGDSLSSEPTFGLGSQVFEHLKGGNEVIAIGSCGSSPRWYQSDTRSISTNCGFLRKQTGKAPEISKSHVTPKLESLIQGSLDLAVIQQGTNLYGYFVGPEKKSPEQAMKLVRSDVKKFLTELVNLVPKSKCLWVAPPEIAKYDGYRVDEDSKENMYRAIESELKEFEQDSGFHCDIHDSRNDTSPPGGDGTHFSNSQQTSKWIGSVNAQVDSLLGVPVASRPSESLLDENTNQLHRARRR